MAVGGFILSEGEKVFPGAAVMAVPEDGDWPEWREEAEEEGEGRRDSFIAAQVPLEWIETLCSV